MRELRAITGAVAVGLVSLIAAGGAPAQPPALKQADAPVSQLERSDSNELPRGAVAMRFEQEVGGVQVAGAGAVVLDARGEPAELLFDKSVEGLEAPGEPAVTRADAVAAALDAIGAPRGGTTTARLVIDATRGNQLAWEVAHFDSSPISDWLVTVSAASGDVIGKEDRLLDATGQAKLFVPNAVVANDGYKGILDRKDKDSDNLTALRSPVSLEDIKDGQNCLRGASAHARLGDDGKKVCKGSLKWNGITRSKNKFEALMAYHHVTEAQQYIQSLEIGADANAERQDVLANSLPADNSFYSPGADQIQLGSGGVDDGEDADVIVHEYGHAVQDDQAPGSYNGSHGGAMGEGFGDYLADAYSTEEVGFDPEWTPCVMEWDATSYDDNLEPGVCLRRADVDNTWEEHKDFCAAFTDPTEIHCIGEVWASALLDLRILLGDDGDGHSIVDRALLASHFMVPNNATFEEGIEALIDADETIYGAGDHCTEISGEMTSRDFPGGVPAC
jgi:Fungalysin metallopeptidase (M36)